MAITLLAKKKIETKTRVLDFKYSVSCPLCHKKREVSYHTVWDIKNNKTSGKCRSCSITPEHKIKLRQMLISNKRTLGFKHSEENKKIIGNFSRRPRPDISGENSPNWKGGITPINKVIRRSREYKQWQISVFKRDNKTCVLCGFKSSNNEADHIKPFCDYPELRFDINNGRTLCKSCHKKTPTYGRKKTK